MTDIDSHTAPIDDSAAAANSTPSPHSPEATPAQQQAARRDDRRWWIKLIIQPILILACGAILIAGLGMAQRFGLISAGDSGGAHTHAAAANSNVKYICPMMCTPPQAEPGRCPVCAMELVPTTSGGGNTDPRSIHVDPATRRVANIHTVAVTSIPMTHTIRAIGELRYDEGTLKTISAYVDGRLERLYADYTGVVVTKGDHLALVYSPRLYSSQIELLLAKKARETSRASSLTRVVESNRDLYDSTRQRLIELGMTESQIEQLEAANEANSRLHLCAPISGTVIEKLAVEGQYVKEGDAIYQLADLSTVWLMLKLFPEDAATIRYGQKVEATVQSLPGRKFTGRVAFVDPSVDPKTRTVGVRVVIPNDEGLLRVGDYAKATVNVPLSSEQNMLVYDPELANKWISPRHPHIIRENAGACPVCGIALVPAADLGFTDQPSESNEGLVVPRNAVLMAGNNSVVYVETEPGRFEIRRVVLGTSSGDQIVIRSGVKLGEHVATQGNFLIDSQMQLAGNPSLIDPTKLQPSSEVSFSAEMLAALSTLSPEDRQLVESQQTCPVADYRLGEMGVPQKMVVKGSTVFICCESCREKLLADPEMYLAKLAAQRQEKPAPSPAHPGHSQLNLPPIDTPRLIEPEGTPRANSTEARSESRTGKSTEIRFSKLPQEAIR